MHDENTNAVEPAAEGQPPAEQAPRDHVALIMGLQAARYALQPRPGYKPRAALCVEPLTVLVYVLEKHLDAVVEAISNDEQGQPENPAENEPEALIEPQGEPFAGGAATPEMVERMTQDCTARLDARIAENPDGLQHLTDDIAIMPKSEEGSGDE